LIQHFEGRVRSLGAEQIEDVALGLVELRARDIPRPGKIERDDPPRARTHHRDMGSERQRLIDAMGHEHDGALMLLPDPNQFILHVHPRLLVERAERLIHQNDLRVHQ
jgi:hypothetical protein